MPRKDVGLIKVLSEGVVVLRWMGDTASPRDALWSKGKLRKTIRCAVSGDLLKPGDMAWRPMGNQDYRSERISTATISALQWLAQTLGAL